MQKHIGLCHFVYQKKKVNNVSIIYLINYISINHIMNAIVYQ